MDLISLLVLLAVIAAAFIFKVNTGLAAIFASLILGRCAGLTDKWLLNSFNSNLFLMLLGVMYLFCIAQENKTLDLLAKKVIALCKGKVKLFPPILFLIGFVLSAIGPGLISITALMAALIVALAEQSKTHPMRLLPFGALGAFAGGLSPITPTGIVGVTVAGENGITGVEMPLFLNMAMACLIYSVILYFFVFKWHKHKNLTADGQNPTMEATPAFSGKQLATLAGIVVVAVLTAAFGFNVGLASFAVAVLLTVFGCADEGAALKKVPWGTLMLVTGVGILISVITELGGIDLLSNALSGIGNGKTASAIMTVLAGVMSWFSSASGVVMPTLIPTAPTVAAAMPGATAFELVVAVSIGANAAALSPLSTCGSLMLAAYSSSEGVTAKDRNRVFLQLFALSASFLVLSAILALLGMFRWG